MNIGCIQQIQLQVSSYLQATDFVFCVRRVFKTFAESADWKIRGILFLLHSYDTRTEYVNRDPLFRFTNSIFTSHPNGAHILRVK